VIGAADGDKVNAMISNSFMQVTSEPLQASVCINKANLTGDMIAKTKRFAVSILNQTNHDLVPRFGFQSGHKVDKFADFDLSRLPDFTFFGVGDLGSTPTAHILLWLIPIIAAGLTWLSMFLTKKWNGTNNVAQDQQAQNPQAQQTTKMMELSMPIMTLIMAFSLSGMMGIYWIYQSLLGILQSYLVAKFMPIPRYTEEELKAMRKAQKQAEKAQKQALKNAPKYRSLHYIDEDDYDTLPEIKSTQKNKKSNETLPDPDINE
jgi:flagellar basal body-associated protein FliL